MLRPESLLPPCSHASRSVPLGELAAFPQVEPGALVPRHLFLDPEHRCPFRCPGCIERDAMVRTGHSALQTTTACSIIRSFAHEAGPDAHVLFYGGEPTAHVGFGQILRCAAENVGCIQLVTNGAYLNDASVRESIGVAAQSSELVVRVSLNAGTPATHSALHGVDGYFDIVVTGMERLSRESRVSLRISFLVEETNAGEVRSAFSIAEACRAEEFVVRPKTGLHGVKLTGFTRQTRAELAETLRTLRARCEHSPASPSLRYDEWFLHFLEDDRPPSTVKPFSSCYYCGAARIVVTPPEPGVAWACPYFRSDARFLIGRLNDAPIGSHEFHRLRKAAVERIIPWRDCSEVICNRSHYNEQIFWSRLVSEA